MAEEDGNVWKDARELLERIKQKARSTPPRGEIEVSRPDLQILGMYWRCVSLFRTVLILLDNNYPEEALILARSLFTESLRLMELEAAGTEREAILLGHYVQSLEQTKALFVQEAKRLGLTDDPSNELAHIEKRKRGLESYMRTKGIRKLRRFNSEKNAAVKLNRQDDLWTFLLSHRMVHGEDTAYMFRRDKVGDDAVAFFSHTFDPNTLAGVGVFAARSISHAAYAAAGILGWEISPELRKLVRELERRVNHS